MPAPGAPLDIVNLALLQLYQGAITSLNDPTDPAAGAGLLIYDQCRRSMLENFDWNFARNRAFAPLVSDKTPAFDFQYFYALPDRFLKLLWIGYDHERYHPRRYDIQGQYLCLNPQGNTNSQSLNLVPTAITRAKPGVVTVASTTGMSNNMQIFIQNIGGMVQLQGYYVAQNITPTTFTLADIKYQALDTSGYSAFTSGGNIIGAGSGVPESSIPVKYTMDVTDITQMSPMFIDCLALEMACRLCMPITGSRTLLADLRKEQAAQQAEANAINHMQKPVLVTERDIVQEARHVSGDYPDFRIDPDAWS